MVLPPPEAVGLRPSDMDPGSQASLDVVLFKFERDMFRCLHIRCVSPTQATTTARVRLVWGRLPPSHPSSFLETSAQCPPWARPELDTGVHLPWLTAPRQGSHWYRQDRRGPLESLQEGALSLASG